MWITTFPARFPESSSLKSMINEAPNVCTSLLVNHYLRGAYREWAVVGTFGDNLKDSAEGLAKNLKLSEQQLTLLENLGIYINYNGYGSDLDELHFKPDELYRLLSNYQSPFDFVSDNAEQFNRLEGPAITRISKRPSLVSRSRRQMTLLSLCCR